MKNASTWMLAGRFSNATKFELTGGYELGQCGSLDQVLRVEYLNELLNIIYSFMQREWEINLTSREAQHQKQ